MSLLCHRLNRLCGERTVCTGSEEVEKTMERKWFLASLVLLFSVLVSTWSWLRR